MNNGPLSKGRKIVTGTRRCGKSTLLDLKEIKKQLIASMKELAKLKRTGENDRDVVFRLVRITAQIWQTHPFREGTPAV